VALQHANLANNHELERINCENRAKDGRAEREREMASQGVERKTEARQFKEMECE